MTFANLTTNGVAGTLDGAGVFFPPGWSGEFSPSSVLIVGGNTFQDDSTNTYEVVYTSSGSMASTVTSPEGELTSGAVLGLGVSVILLSIMAIVRALKAGDVMD